MYERVLLIFVLVLGIAITLGCSSKDDSADKANGSSRGDTNAQTPKPDASLTNTYWKLIELDGERASLGEGQKELSVVLTDDDDRMRGFSGCNQFAGPYMATNGRLHIGPLVSTKKACEEGMEQEQRFLEALGRTKRFNISGDNLVFYGRDGKRILLFVAVYLK